MAISYQEATGVNAVSIAAGIGAKVTMLPLPSFIRCARYSVDTFP